MYARHTLPGLYLSPYNQIVDPIWAIVAIQVISKLDVLRNTSLKIP